MGKNMETIVIGVVIGILVLVCEYFVFRPVVANLNRLPKRKLVHSAVVALVLPIPLLLLQRLSILVVQILCGDMSRNDQIDVYTPLFAILSLLWGYVFAVLIRQRLIDFVNHLLRW